MPEVVRACGGGRLTRVDLGKAAGAEGAVLEAGFYEAGICGG